MLVCRLVGAFYLQLASYLLCIFAISIQHYLRTTNQDQLMISGREQTNCTGNSACAAKSVRYSLKVLLNVVQKSLVKCTIYMDYALDFMYLLCLCYCLETIFPLQVECNKIFFVKDVFNPWKYMYHRSHICLRMVNAP